MSPRAVNTDSGQSVPLWVTDTEIPSQPSLRRNLKTDVCIVGAGIAGLTTAYLLAKAGQSVVVLDDGPTAGGETSRTTAHLASALDDLFYNIEWTHGEEGARLAAESHAAAIDRIEAIVEAESIDCGFQRLDGYLFCGPNDTPDSLERELFAARKAGLTEVEPLDRAPLDQFDTGPCLRFPRQGQFHPLRYLAGITRAIEAMGGQIFNGTHVDHIEGGDDAHVGAGDRTVSARALVVATNAPVNDLFAIHTKQAPYRTYVIGVPVPRGSIVKALYWDTDDPYHYVRIQAMPQNGEAHEQTDMLIVGGEDHKTGHADDAEVRWDKLEAWTRERFPMAGKVEFRWSGQVMEPVDYMAFIGRNPGDEPNVYIATGDSGHGMTHGTIAGILLTDLILGRANPWERLYDPSRKTLRAAGDFLKENLDVAGQYAALVTPGQVDKVDDIGLGQGAIMRRGLKKLAIYRQEDGSAVTCSAICPHLGCVVEWNHAEKSWDCPCHGSRFKATGEVINGPAISNLSKEEE